VYSVQGASNQSARNTHVDDSMVFHSSLEWLGKLRRIHAWLLDEEQEDGEVLQGLHLRLAQREEQVRLFVSDAFGQHDDEATTVLQFGAYFQPNILSNLGYNEIPLKGNQDEGQRGISRRSFGSLDNRTLEIKNNELFTDPSSRMELKRASATRPQLRKDTWKPVLR